MNIKEWFGIKKPKPACVGMGLIALDVVINGDPKAQPRFWAGGSCGNVLTILSYLGWKSYPIARLGEDEAAKELMKDMEKWKVKTPFIYRSNSCNTPIIVEKIGTSKAGKPRHRFEWICPSCGSCFPKYKPVLSRDVQQISKGLPHPQVFFFDRISRSSIELAKVNKKHGALIVFEPSGIKDKKLFHECLQLADILKYSHERLGHSQVLNKTKSVSLIIETLGAEGLRYRLSNNSKQSRRWKIVPAHPVKTLKDTAGAGDWCSAGLIHLLGRAGIKGFKNIKEKSVLTAINFGQALAALNCCYEGARGSMYNMSRREFEELIFCILNGERGLESSNENGADNASKTLRCICPHCLKEE